MEKDFAEWLDSELESRGWSQSDLSRKSGITTAQISRVLNRERMPGIEFCRDALEALDVRVVFDEDNAGRAVWVATALNLPQRFEYINARKWRKMH